MHFWKLKLQLSGKNETENTLYPEKSNPLCTLL